MSGSWDRVSAVGQLESITLIQKALVIFRNLQRLVAVAWRGINCSSVITQFDYPTSQVTGYTHSLLPLLAGVID